MGLLKKALGLSGTDRVGERLVNEAAAARARGDSEIWLTYTQSEIGIRGNASQMGLLVRRRLEKAGYPVLESNASGRYGDDVQLLVRCQQ